MTLKAGCYVVNKEKKAVALIYREQRCDYTFPKGHLEPGETLLECAIRETAEEIKRNVKIIKGPYISRYITPSGENIECHMYLAFDNGVSDNMSLDTHELIWVPIDKVLETLSYDSLKKDFKIVLKDVLELIKN